MKSRKRALTADEKTNCKRDFLENQNTKFSQGWDLLAKCLEISGLRITCHYGYLPLAELHLGD